jgi:hypothetical protein
LTFFASKLAPTGECVFPNQAGPQAAVLLILMHRRLERPSGGSAQWATRQGCRVSRPGHGWPMAAGPRSRTGARACRATARHRTKGARGLGYLGLFQVTRRKGVTNSSPYRRNGYVHLKENGRLPGRHRNQPNSNSRAERGPISHNESSIQPLAPTPQPSNINPMENMSKSPSS